MVKKFKKAEGNVSRCNLCGRINICDEDKKEHAKVKHNGEINVKDDYPDKENLHNQIGIQILAYERGYKLTKPRIS